MMPLLKCSSSCEGTSIEPDTRQLWLINSGLCQSQDTSTTALAATPHALRGVDVSFEVLFLLQGQHRSARGKAALAAPKWPVPGSSLKTAVLTAGPQALHVDGASPEVLLLLQEQNTSAGY